MCLESCVMASLLEEMKQGSFVRSKSQFMNVISPSHELFKPEKGRYHLYLSQACPWCHRVEMVMRLKGLWNNMVIGVTYVAPTFGEIGEGKQGWEFCEYSSDPINGLKTLLEVYQFYSSGYSGRATVPLLIDLKTQKIVSNESSVIVESLNRHFEEFSSPGSVDLSPMELENQIGYWKDAIYESLNNGVYKTGFATDQSVYNQNVKEVFACLDKLENHLETNLFLCGDKFTMADIFLFPTLVRFDAVYNIHFKCCFKRISDYPNLSNYARFIYQMRSIKPSVDFFVIRTHYYTSHRHINPSGIIPVAPEYDWDAPTNRLEKNSISDEQHQIEKETAEETETLKSKKKLELKQQQQPPTIVPTVAMESLRL